MNGTSEHDSNLEAEIVELARTPIGILRQRWRTLFRAEPPPAFGPDLLRRSIAQKLQEQRFGGLSVATQRQIANATRAASTSPAGRIELPKRLKHGAVLVRTWKDKSYRVTVREQGFEFDGRVFASLSEIARQITGSRWNGPRFFGLRKTEASHGE